ncbi:MAG: hypothetical protein OIN66_17145 [Candidatus Methanoperedens sp.]|nr:hypothetical protein [Candidatus Methanoperedens sp.]
MNSKEVWFSHREKKWDVKNGKFNWTDTKDIWDWDCCTVRLARTPKNELIVVVRSKTDTRSTYLGRYMFTWSRVPGADNSSLLSYLKDDLDISLDGAKILKSDDENTISISDSEKSVEIKLEKEYESALLKVSDGRTYTLQVKKENGTLKIYMGKPVELRFMFGFGICKISEPRVECYIAQKNKPEKREGPKKRWVFQLENDYWFWEWAKEGGDIKSSNTYGLYELINREMSSPSIESDNIFDVELDEKDDRIIPVIYMPAVDTLGNFLREVHCAEKPPTDNGSVEVEVSLVFNNELLRRHSLVHKIYEVIRRLRYGRTRDIETFKIIARKDFKDNALIFEDIYSDYYQLEEDTIHGDPHKAPERGVRYYFIDYRHPVIFINTSNHAMAGHDTNHHIWKWEYIPWLEHAPVKLDCKTREEIDKEYKPIIKF